MNVNQSSATNSLEGKYLPKQSQVLKSSAPYISYCNHKKFWRGMINNLVFKSPPSNKEFVVERGKITSTAPCGHWIRHLDCGGCGVLLCPFNCKCFD